MNVHPTRFMSIDGHRLMPFPAQPGARSRARLDDWTAPKEPMQRSSSFLNNRRRMRRVLDHMIEGSLSRLRGETDDRPVSTGWPISPAGRANIWCALGTRSSGNRRWRPRGASSWTTPPRRCGAANRSRAWRQVPAIPAARRSRTPSIASSRCAPAHF